MTTQSSGLNEMKSKPTFTIVISITLSVGLVTWAYMTWNKETPSSEPAKMTDKSPPEKSTGRKWFSALPSSQSNGATDKFGLTVDLDGKTVSQYVKSLYDAANKGDAKAAYNIYAAETICTTTLPKSQQELVNIPVNTEQNYVDALRHLVKNSQDVCADYKISPRERLDFLNTAAKGGDVSAMMTFGTEPPDGIDQTKPLDMNDPRTVQWLNDSVDYMKQAAAKGNALAMMGVATYYEQGDIVQKNIPLALTYEIAAQMQRNPSATSYDNYPTIARLESQLIPDQITTAKADAAALIKSSTSSR